MLTNLNQLLLPAFIEGRAVPAFSVCGYEDAIAVSAAAQTCDAPVILSCDRTLIDFLGVQSLAAMLTQLAESSEVPVCLHLERCHEPALIRQAVDHGFTSLGFDGSQLPLAENIRLCAELADYVRAAGASLEGCIERPLAARSERQHSSFVAGELEFSATQWSEYVKQAELFSTESGVDAIALSLPYGLVSDTLSIDRAKLAELELVVEQPLSARVSEIPPWGVLLGLHKSAVCKFDIESMLAEAACQSINMSTLKKPARLQRDAMIKSAVSAMQSSASELYQHLGYHGADHG